MVKKIEEHAFSVEIKSERYVKRMSFLDKETDHFFFEGFLGTLQNVSLVEGLMLEIVGINGILRVDITQQEIANCIKEKKNIVGGEQ